MILEDLRGYLLANSVSPIYLSFEPPTSGVTLYIYPGGQADPWNPEYRYYNIQAVTRFQDYAQAQIVANRVYALLQNLSRQVGATEVVNSYAKQEPYQFGTDIANFVRLGQNFSIEVKIDSSIDPQGYVTRAGYTVDWDNIVNTPTTVSGYGITDVLSSLRNLTINGVTQDLSADRTWNVGDVYTTSSYANPSWITSLAYSKLTGVPPSSGTGTVTHVGLSLPNIFSVAGSPITSSGTLVATLVSQSGVFASPAGSTGTPAFRSLVSSDIPPLPWSILTGTPTTLSGYGIVDGTPLSRSLSINGTSYNLSADRSWFVGDVYTTSSYANPSWITALDYSKLTNVPPISGAGTVTFVGLSLPNIFSVSGSPVTVSGTLAAALVSQNANTFFGGPISGSAVPAFRALVSGDLPNVPWGLLTGTPTTLSGYGIADAVSQTRLLTINGVAQNLSADRTWVVGDLYSTSGYANPSWITSLDYGKLINVPPTSGAGTVTYVGLSAPSIFTVSGSPVVSSGTLNLSLVSQSAYRVFASPSGTSGIPTFRSLVLEDLPAIPFSLLVSKPSSLLGYGINDPLVSGTRVLTINGLAQDLLADRSWSVGNVFTTSAYANPDWITSLDYSKITNIPLEASGTVTFVGLQLPNIFSVTGSPITSSGSFVANLVSQASNSVFASPDGSAGTPSFRSLVLGDLPAIPFSYLSSRPTSLFGYGINDPLVSGTRQLTINGLTQDLLADRTWNVGNVFTTSAYVNPSWIVSLDYSKLTNVPASSGTGTVTYVGFSAPNIFTVSGSPIVSSGTIGLTLATQNANTVFSGPSTGGAAQPTFRTLVLADLPTIDFADLGVTPTTLAGYGITDAYTRAESDSRFVPSGLYPPVSMYWTSSGNIYFVAHSGMVIGAPYVAGSGYLTYSVARSSNQALFSAVSGFPLILSYNDVFLVSCSGLSIYKSATFPRIG